MKNLNIFLDKCVEEYYKGTPIISDSEYDYLATLAQYESLGVKPNKNKVKHLAKLLSLKKLYEGKDSIPESSDDYIETEKLDGAAIALIYADGKLVSAATRGDGEYGEDITNNVISYSLVPTTIDIGTNLAQITGEVVAPSSIKNARNYAAGALQLKNTEELKERELYFIAYGIFPSKNTLYTEDMELLESLGFTTVTNYKDKLAIDFPTDGKVFRINSNSKYVAMGSTEIYPKGAYAVKQESDFNVEKTVLRDVVWQTGKTGKVVPVAIFDPVELSDAIVTRATLHNPGFIESLGIRIGDTILVTRSGGIIPKVLGVSDET